MIPWLWEAPPTDRRYYPLYAACVELGVPFCTQVGHTGPLRPSEPGRPIPYIDQVAIDFPELVIVCGHIGYPWTEEMVAVARKHENVYIDTSAYTARRYPPELVAYLRTRGGQPQGHVRLQPPDDPAAAGARAPRRAAARRRDARAVPPRQRRAGVRAVSANRIALLRGINIGPRQRVKMPELRELWRASATRRGDARAERQRRLHQPRRPEDARAQLEQEIEKELGVDPKVVVRTRDELAAVIEANPFPDTPRPRRTSTSRSSPASPTPRRVKTLEATDFGDDRLAFRGREIYIAYKDGMGRSELAKQLAKAKLGVTATDRNWNTVTNAAGDG